MHKTAKKTLTVKSGKILQPIINDKKKLIALTAAVVLITALIIFLAASGGNTEAYEYQADKIKRTVFSNEVSQKIISDMQKSSPSPIYAVLISVCDGKEAAKVTAGTGSSLTEAWNEAYKNGKKTVRRFNIETKWVRADVVNTVDAVTPESLKGKYLKSSAKNSLHYGISFSDDYENAVLAEEINANGIINYDDGAELSLEKLNSYLKTQKKSSLKALPDKMRVFTAQSFICSDDNVYGLMNDTANSNIRSTAITRNKTKLEDIIRQLSEKLSGSLSEDGIFTYYLNPYDEKGALDGYDIAAHCKTVSALAERYRALPDKSLKKLIDLTLPYITKSLSSPDKSSEFAFARNGEHDEVYLGDTALAAVALADYIDITALKSPEAEEALLKLGNGIMKFMDEESGVFEHTLLYPSLEPDDCFRDETYNSLAAYALCRIYEVTGDQEWIDSAALATDRIIASSGIQSINKWYILSLEKLGKLTGNNNYYITALNYVNDNISEIADGSVCNPEYLDLLISAYNIFAETDKNTYVLSKTQDFDAYAFSLTLSNYTDFLFNRYYYPENAMYFDNAEALLGNFFSPENDFVSSADTVQGFLHSFSLYYSRFDALSVLYSSFN